MYARSNGLFPTQDKIVAKIKKAWKNLGDRGYVRLKIPWSDFEFSSVEPWPKSYREGLQAYREYLANLDYTPPEDDEPRYEISPCKAIEWQQKSAQWKRTRFSTYSNVFSPKQLFEEAIEYPSILSHVFWDTRNEKVTFSGFIPFLRPLLPRKADEDYVFLELQKHGTKGELYAETGVLGRFADRINGYVLNIRFERWGTIAHEIMHFAQEVGDQLLWARSAPDEAFLTYYKSKPDATGLGAQPKIDFQKLFDLEKTAYSEKPVEFYPRAYSSAYSALKMSPNWPLLDRVGAACVETAFEMFSDKQRFLFIKAAYQYAKQLQSTQVQLSPEEIQEIRLLSNAFDLDQMATILAYLLVFLKKTEPAKWEAGSTFYSHILNIIFRHRQLEARHAGGSIDATLSTYKILDEIREDAVDLANGMFDEYTRLTGVTLDRTKLLQRLDGLLDLKTKILNDAQS